MQAQALKVKEKLAFTSKLEAMQQNRDLNHSFKYALDSMENLEKAPEFGKYDNQRVLKELDQERERLSLEVKSLGFVGLVLLVLGPSVIPATFFLAALTPTRIKLSRIQKLAQVIAAMEKILEAFEEQGVEIFPFVEVDIEAYKPIDLFVRFPQKVFLLISIENKRQSAIFFNEKREALFLRRKKNKGIKIWQPDPVEKLAKSHAWLQKNRRDLFGGSSRDSRKPLTKAILLSGETRLGKHNEHLIWKNDERFIKIRTVSNAVVGHERDVADFIRLFLTDNK